MTTAEYLANILKDQTLATDSRELKDLQERRAEVEDHLRAQFSDAAPTIRYGGSKAKGTMIKESYDLDIVCYFSHDDPSAGDTLETIYHNVRNALEKKYLVEQKSSALRIKDADPTRHGTDFHIDVVPGRFTDDNKSDAYLYVSNGEKSRLKTNLDVHIAHVRDSGVTDANRLMKLWKVRNHLSVRNFVLELAVIKLLAAKKSASLPDQMLHLWTELRDNIDDLVVEDPANPKGNDLAGLLNAVKPELQSMAKQTLAVISSSGWESVFGNAEEERQQNVAALRRAATVATPARAWCKTDDEALAPG